MYITAVIINTDAGFDLQVLNSYFLHFFLTSLWSKLVWLSFMWYNITKYALVWWLHDSGLDLANSETRDPSHAVKVKFVLFCQ